MNRVRLAALAFLALAPRAATAAAQDRIPQPDTIRVTVDGHQMVLLVSGASTGPTIVLEPGGGPHGAMAPLPDSLAPFARVVAYDRPGYGLSGSCERPRSARVIAEELHAALEASGIAPPYVLVGWSLGGSFARVYAGLYPGEVAGLVLIDPAPEHFYPRAAREQPEVWQPLLAEQEARVARSGPGHRGEWAAWDSTMAQSVASDSSVRAPIVLLTATRSDDSLQEIWIEEHRRWAARMPRVRHLLVEGAGHPIHRDRPGAVVNAVREVLAAD